MAININHVVVTGNLTRDPELRQAGSTQVCGLRIAVNGRRKDSSGSWVDDPNYFDVSVFGSQGENAARYLEKGRPVAIDGRLNWREWKDKEGNKRQTVDIIANTVQFLGGKDGGSGGGSSSSGSSSSESSSDDSVAYSPTEADIPFAWEGPVLEHEHGYHENRPTF